MMKIYSSIFVLIVMLAASFSASEADAQTRRKKASAKSSTAVKRQPARQPPGVVQAEVISTAEDILRSEGERSEDEQVTPNPTNGKTVKPNRKSAQASREAQTPPDNTAQLTRQINELTEKIKSLETQQRGLIDLEKLSRAEERAEVLRRQLGQATEREAELNLKLEQLEEQSRPENIQRETAVVGSTRPEEMRAARQKIIENEKTRARDQLAQLQTSRARLETAVANADAFVDKLRARVEAADNETAVETSADANAKTPTEPVEDRTEEIPNP